MSLESQILDALTALAPNKVFPDVAPPGTVAPYITYQQVGGDAINFMDGSAPGKANARVQVNVWASTRVDASALGAQVELALRAASALNTEVLGAAVATYESATLRGTRQDFSFWY